jgi:hypothetical protein
VLVDPWYQAIGGITIVVTALVLHVHAKPYERRLFNRLELVVLCALVTTQVVSLLFLRSEMIVDGATGSTLDTIVTLVLVLLNGGVLLGLVVCGVHSVTRCRCCRDKSLLRKPESSSPSGVHIGARNPSLDLTKDPDNTIGPESISKSSWKTNPLHNGRSKT